MNSDTNLLNILANQQRTMTVQSNQSIAVGSNAGLIGAQGPRGHQGPAGMPHDVKDYQPSHASFAEELDDDGKALLTISSKLGTPITIRLSRKCLVRLLEDAESLQVDQLLVREGVE